VRSTVVGPCSVESGKAKMVTDGKRRKGRKPVVLLRKKAAVGY
jgi:hypothetical protein